MIRSASRCLFSFFSIVGLVLIAASPAALAADPTLEEIKKPPAEAERHESGLISLKLKDGTGDRHPDFNDVALVHFTGWTPEGEVFRTTIGDKPGTFPLDKVFPGWSEGIRLMVEGEKRRLWVPSHLGPQNPSSGPKGAAVFDVELIQVMDLPDAPKYLKEPDPKAKRLPSGTSYLIQEAGNGGQRPGDSGRVLLHYTLWNQKGRTIDSTFSRNRPTAFLLDRVMPAFSEAIQEMTIGEKRYLWIPAFAHEGQWPNGPKGMMIFEVQLLRILPENVLQPQEGAGKPPTEGAGKPPAKKNGD